MKGKVKFFNGGKGFGFIASEDGKEYFVHLTGVQEGVKLFENDDVEFDVEEGERGPKAVNVRKGDAAPAEEPAQEETTEEPVEETTEEPVEEAEEPAQEETEEPVEEAEEPAQEETTEEAEEPAQEETKEPKEE